MQSFTEYTFIGKWNWIWGQAALIPSFFDKGLGDTKWFIQHCNKRKSIDSLGLMSIKL